MTLNILDQLSLYDRIRSIAICDNGCWIAFCSFWLLSILVTINKSLFELKKNVSAVNFPQFFCPGVYWDRFWLPSLCSIDWLKAVVKIWISKPELSRLAFSWSRYAFGICVLNKNILFYLFSFHKEKSRLKMGKLSEIFSKSLLLSSAYANKYSVTNCGTDVSTFHDSWFMTHCSNQNSGSSVSGNRWRIF